MADLAFRAATDLAAAIRRKEIGAVELLEHYLARVERHDGALNAVVVRDFDRARERAKAADAALARGELWGPLHGLPMTVKEAFNITGLPTSWGVPEMKGNTAAGNAYAVDRLLDAGAVIFGKTNVPLLLSDLQSYNAIYGTTNNPWDTCLKQMVEAYEEVGGNIVAAMEVAQEETSRYGIITAEGGRAAAAPGELVGVKALVEKPAPEEAPSRLAVIGRYILQPEVFDQLSQTRAGAGGEIQLTDAMAAMIGETPFHALAFEGERFDCGDKAGFLCANLAFGLARSDIGPSVAEFLGQRLHALYGSKYGR